MTKVLTPLRKFSFDRWEETKPELLIPGDLISMGDVTAVFNGMRTEENDKKTTVISAAPLERGAMKIHLGETGSNWEFIVVVMDYTGSSCEEFPDGTAIITEFDGGNTHVYSPRLPLSDLNSFCRDNLVVYEQFYSENSSGIENGDRISMSRFW